MLADAKIMAFAPTADPKASRSFYEGKLGLRFVSEDPFALVFDCAGTTLRIQKVDRLVPQPFTTLGWQVADIEASVAGLEENGVIFERFEFTGGNAIWTAPGGARIAWFKDPDGNILSLTQIP